MKKPFVCVWTELIKMPYTRELVSGFYFHGSTIVAAMNHSSDGKHTYFDGDHKRITKKLFNKIKTALEKPQD